MLRVRVPSCRSKPCGELHPSEEFLPMLEWHHAEGVAAVVVEEVGFAADTSPIRYVLEKMRQKGIKIMHSRNIKISTCLKWIIIVHT